MPQKFIVGNNAPWLHYGNDLAGSQWSGSMIWHWPHDAPLPHTRNLTEREPNPGPGKMSEADMDAFLAPYRGLVVRFWLFEQFQGLIFDDTRITGIMGAMYSDLQKSELEKFLLAARRNGVRLYLCLFNGWDSHFDGRYAGPPARRPVYDKWIAKKKEIYRRLLTNPGEFALTTLWVLLRLLNKYLDVVYAVDLMNEPEGLSTFDHLTFTTTAPKAVVDKALKEWVAYAKHQFPKIPVSIGCMTKWRAQEYARTTQIDFADYHTYNVSGMVPPYYKEDFAGKPCILGEAGYPVSPTNANVRVLYELPIAQRMITEAHRLGYAGAFSWGLQDFVRPENGQELLKRLRNLSSANLTVQPQQPNFFAWFFSLFGRK